VRVEHLIGGHPGSGEWIALGQDVDGKAHYQLVVLVESLVAAANDTPAVAYDSIRLLNDFLGVGECVSGSNRALPLQVLEPHAGPIAAAILDPVSEALHVFHHQAHPHRTDVPA
jgi:hypothetical protein